MRTKLLYGLFSIIIFASIFHGALLTNAEEHPVVKGPNVEELEE